MKMKSSIHLIIVKVLTLLLVTVVSSGAADYYVSPSGSATWPNCTLETPCHPHAGLNNAVAGDTVYFMDGQYTVTTNHTDTQDWKESLWKPANSGTAGNPITFKSLNIHQAHLHRVGSGGVAFIGTKQRDHIVWDGFYLTTISPEGVIRPAIIRMHLTNGIVLRNLKHRGGNVDFGGKNNHDSIRIEDATDILLENNEIYGMCELSSNEKNTNGVKTYNVNGLIIRNNKFHSACNAHVYVKEKNHWNVLIENNYFLRTDANRGLEVSATRASNAMFGVIIRNNIFVSRLAMTHSGDHGGIIEDLEIYNNTFLVGGPGWVFAPDGKRAKIYNNIAITTGSALQSIGSATIAGMSAPAEVDHNFLTGGNIAKLNIYGIDAVTYSTLAAWQASGALYGGGNPGTGSITGDPFFVDAMGTIADGTGTELDDFRLAPNSPAIGAGRNGVNMGADIDKVGPLNAKSQSLYKALSPSVNEIHPPMELKIN